MLADDVFAGRQEGVDDAGHVFRIEPDRERDGADEIADQRRDLPPLGAMHAEQARTRRRIG
ncbi:hypothetical protein ACRAVF_31810 [Bradyrhizobium oligotrophicum S58]